MRRTLSMSIAGGLLLMGCPDQKDGAADKPTAAPAAPTAGASVKPASTAAPAAEDKKDEGGW